MKIDNIWLKRIVTGILISIAAYILTIILFLPAVQFNIFRFLPANTYSHQLRVPREKIDIVSPVKLPELHPISGAALPLPTENLLLITCFSYECQFVLSSVPFWKRLTHSLPTDKVNHVFIGTSQSVDEIHSFIKLSKLSAPMFYSNPDSAESVFNLKKGIVHCLIDKNGAILGMWKGMPITGRYEAQMTDEIIQSINEHYKRKT